jgi:aminomethyltransferase
LAVDETLRRTPLHALHVAAGARMVEFAGWHMPVQYAGVLAEHEAVRTRVGLFDVSHMGEIRVRGRQALDCLQRLTCNDVGRLLPGRAQYTALLTHDGCFVDDLLVYQLAPGDYLAVVNASNTPKDVAWCREHARGFDAEVSDESRRWGQLALQGPRAEAVLSRLTRAELAGLAYFAFLRADVAGVDCIVSRTGYTGEDGFEIYAPADGAAPLWTALLECGRPEGIAPIGLGARDTLRLEAALMLYGNDIDESTTAWEADLGWIVKLGKGEFIGRPALVRQKEVGIERKLVGFEMRGRAIARHGQGVVRDEREVGRVTSGSFAPHLGRGVGLAYVPTALATPGTPVTIDVRGREEPAVVVPTPFYRRK